MGSLRAVVVLSLLLGAGGLAVAQTPFGPPEYEVWNDPNAECWFCHRPGAYDPDMDPFVAVLPNANSFAAGDAFTLETSIASVWPSDQGDYLLQDFRVTMDISNAPSLTFVSDQEPVDETFSNLAIPIDPTAVFADPNVPAQDPSYLTREHSGFHVLQVPAGATDVVITLIPSETGATAPDMRLKIHPGTTDPTGEAVAIVDANGRGGAERFQANTPAELGAYGTGNWTIEASTTPLDADEPGPPLVGPAGFSVRMQAWFNASANVQQVLTSDDAIAPQQQTLLTWNLAARDAPSEGESLLFTVNLTAYYLHDGGNNDQNWGDMTYTQTIPLLPAEEPDAYRIGAQDGPIIVELAPTGVSLAAISEVVGYISAFLLVASVWTGGMFGKSSRRQLNSIFGSARRRVAFHNFLSYGIIAFALVHMILFIWDLPGPLSGDGYHWLVGVLLGGPAVLAMLLLGVTGAIQVPMIRKWNYSVWRWSHFWLAIAAIAFTIVHMLLDGANFAFIKDAIGYNDPLVPDAFEL